MKMKPELFEQYARDPVGMDASVRRACGIPEDRYYTVSVWPSTGKVRVSRLHRTVVRAKVSKSDQKT